jgi:hypothetical protein
MPVEATGTFPSPVDSNKRDVPARDSDCGVRPRRSVQNSYGLGRPDPATRGNFNVRYCKQGKANFPLIIVNGPVDNDRAGRTLRAGRAQ